MGEELREGGAGGHCMQCTLERDEQGNPKESQRRQSRRGGGRGCIAGHIAWHNGKGTGLQCMSERTAHQKLVRQITCKRH
eukprot:1161874-Pelagomonas_calceolata.AAC.4